MILDSMKRDEDGVFRVWLGLQRDDGYLMLEQSNDYFKIIPDECTTRGVF